MNNNPSYYDYPYPVGGYDHQPPFPQYHNQNQNQNPNNNNNSNNNWYPPEYQNYPHDDHVHAPTAPSFPQFTAPAPAPAPSYYTNDHDPNASGVNFDSWGAYHHHHDHDHSTAAATAGGGGSDDGVYRYEGANVEPYGARGTSGSGSSSTCQVMFDDYGRPITAANTNTNTNGGVKIVRAAPAPKEEEDIRGGGGIQKFRVKLLAEGYAQTDIDVLFQVGLDGIHMLDPATCRTLRIYPFDTVIRWEVLDSCIFAFWAQMPVDFEPKRIRLKSTSYTTTTILDTVTAANVQLKEIAEGKVPNSSRTPEQFGEKKKGFVDWVNLIKPTNEEKDHWVPDEAVNKCTSCGTNFNAFQRKHHCRNCGEIFCDKCTQGRTPLTLDEEAQPVRVCDRCMGEVTQRLDNAREAANRTGSLLSHEDLAKKLKEEMDRNSKAPSAGLKFEGAKINKREVECPTCTVHLQVEVPSSGSETIECSVCQHPFLVSAH